MSADNWTDCPMCHKKALLKKERQDKKVEESYGRVSRDEYAKLVAQAQAPIKVEDHMREDYSLGVRTTSRRTGKSEEVVFYIRYSCACQDCGFSFDFDHEQAIKLDEKKLNQIDDED